MINEVVTSASELTPVHLNRDSFEKVEDKIRASGILPDQGAVDRESAEMLTQLRRDLDSLGKNISRLTMSGIQPVGGYGKDDLVAKRLATIKLTLDTIKNLEGEVMSGADPAKPQDSSPVMYTPPSYNQTITPDPENLGWGYGATHHQLGKNSVETDPSKLTEGYKVIKKDETVQDTFPIPPIPNSAVVPDDEDELILQAYHEMVESLQDRLEGTYEHLRELDVQTGNNTPAIKVLIKGYVKSPHAKAAQKQEDAIGATMPGTDKIPGYETGYESYMNHSTANPKKWG